MAHKMFVMRLLYFGDKFFLKFPTNKFGIYQKGSTFAAANEGTSLDIMKD